MKDIDFIILKDIIDRTIRISEKHKPVLNKLTGLGYIKYIDGSWVVTEEGMKISNERSTGNSE